ncbi:bromodomain adjacent to zinc finger domain protein 2B-like isoform X3 [Liolophura sinensis]|uniref:bromodomain adjacent to zinc finger domain protein 2B-like isoform X3 n=1 Tax=Liolophura sinensis TaxID=3198878 RepID=UPI0031598C4E
MEKGEKSSPSPSRGLNYFDTANLLGPSPFSSSAALAPPFAHLAHIPSAFSMLGRIPPFPAPPPFGGLGALTDPLRASSALAHSSCSSTGSFLHNAFTSTSPLSMVSPLKLTSSSLTSPSSSKATSSKTSNSSAVTSSSSRGSGHHCSHGHSRSSPMKESSGRSRGRHKSSNSLATSTSASSPKSDSFLLSAGKKSNSASPLSISSLLFKNDHSQSLGEKRSESDSLSDASSPSSLSSDDSSGSSGDEKEDSFNRKKKGRSRKSSDRNSQGSAVIQIDGAKKQLMADQIRQKMQGKLTMPPPSIMGRLERHRGRGRPPRNSVVSNMDHSNEDQKMRQDLKKQLEAELKQQQLKLKLLKHAQTQKDKEAAAREDLSRPLNLQKNAGKGKGSVEKTSQVLPYGNDVEKGSDMERHLAKIRSVSEGGSESNHSDVSSDSDMDNDDMNSGLGSSGDSDNSDPGKSTVSEGSASPSKRGADTSSDSNAPHKRRRVMDEKELRIPLEHGWRRETRIRTVGSRGIAGEVLYYAPCGKKLKTYPDVTRYLEKNGITDLTRENFTFSSKYNIGDFMEARHGENGFTVLSEEEVMGRLMWAEKRRNQSGRSSQRNDRRRLAHDVARQAVEVKLRKKLEQQDMARRSAEMKLLRKLEKQRQKEEERRNKQLKVMERKKQKNQIKMMKQHEKLQRQEQMRMEREMRAQQILEARRRRKEDIEKLRYEEALRKAQDREMKRQQAVLMKEQEREWQKQMMLIANMERERRRQHMLLVKALEARRKQEEREKAKEEKKAEKIFIREKKVEQKRLEMQLAQELKQPREDLELRDLKQLPDLNRLPGVKLPGQALADCIMVLEFLNNFGEALGFDSTSMPNLDTLQKGLMNDNEDDVEELMSIITHLVQFAIDDPGVPNPKEALTKMGQKITDLEVTDTVVSEVLRVFVKARAGKQHELCKLLEDKPIEALNSTQKAAILAFLCNEILCSRLITSEIDNNIETMSNLRRDKWVVEGKLRKLRVVHAKKFNRPEQKAAAQLDNSTISNSSIGGETDTETNMSQPMMETQSSKQGSDEEDDESGNESDATNVTGNNSEEEDPITAEECEKKIEKLTKQHSQYRNKVFSASHKLRGTCFGQDRYKRWYWVLPYLGGVFVEGLESGELGGRFDFTSTSKLCMIDQRTDEMKQRLEKCKLEIQKLENGELEEEQRLVKTEPMDVSEENVKPCPKLEADSEKLTPKAEVNGLEHTTSNSTSESQNQPNDKSLCNGDVDAGSNHVPVCKQEGVVCEKDTESSSHLSQEKAASNNLSDLLNSKPEVSSDETCVKTSSPVITSMPLTNGTASSESSVTESKPSFLSIDSMLKKEDTGPTLHNNHFLPPGLLPDGPFSAEQMLKNLSDRQNHKPWFSILPRLACDGSAGDHSSDLPRAQLNSSMSFLSPVPFRAFQMHSPTFSSFQMGQIGVSQSDYNLLPLTPKSSTPGGDSFKVPNTPGECPTTSNSPAPSDLLKYEPAEPIPIPEDSQRGWWRITNPDHFKSLVRSLHPRGIRERDLQKAFQKSFDFVCQSCTKGDKEALVIEETKEEDDDTKDEDEDEEEEEEEAVQEEEATETKEEGEEKINDKEESTDEKVEEDKSAVSPPDSSAPPPLTAPDPDDPDVWDATVAFEIESSVLEEVEAMEDRIFTASLQVKGWKLPEKIAEMTEVETVSRANTVLKETQVYPLEVAKDKLLKLEKNIERRYLKPPFSKSVQIKLENITTKLAEANSAERRRMEEDQKEDQEESEEEKEEQKDVSKEKLPAGLVSWRSAVSTATSPAQLALCLYQLNRSIAWEKSIMKVLCQLCRKDDNEAELLLCDSCDKGYHTYCFKPKMVSIPDGDWYCYECISKATGLPHCAVCGKKTGKLLECGTCPRALHMDCMESPPAKAPKKWFCPSCVAEKSKNKKSKKKAKKDEKAAKETKKDRRDPESVTETSTPEPKTKKGKTTPVVDSTKDSEDLEPCRVLLPEMEKHEDSWPFLQPVNTKQFPQYKKYIKHPMDFSTMRTKLKENVYKSRGEFAADARLVFNNCETFNEDDSEVGKAGHNMRKLFEQRWKELCSQNS